jgi:hypothetical protein
MGGATYGNLRHGYTKGGRHSPEHATWTNMLQRCRPESADRAMYFDRGIRVCDRWLTFDNFIADMGPRPVGGSLDRRDNAKGYSPDNCRWATASEQARNRRSARLVTALGETMTLAAWAERTGINYATLKQRLKLGWSPDRAMSEPVGPSNRRTTGSASRPSCR